MAKLEVGYILTNGSITLIYGGFTKVIAAQDERFEKVLAAIRAGKQEEIPEIVDATSQFRKAGIEVEEGLLKVKGMTMPPELNSRIMEYKNKKIPFQSLLNFWKNLQENPSFHTRQMLFKFLDNEGHAITEDGHFTGYRGVTEDFKDVHSKSFNNSPGQICKMPREMVDDDHTRSCSHGLHVGGFEYAKAFGPKLVIVKVNPRDVVAVPDAYQGNKLRVCQFEVLSETQAALQETVVSKKGTKIDQFEADDVILEFDETFDDMNDLDFETGGLDGPVGKGRSLSGEALKLFESTEKMTPAQKRAHTKRYSNNHAKRDKTGKFVAKKKRK